LRISFHAKLLRWGAIVCAFGVESGGVGVVVVVVVRSSVGDADGARRSVSLVAMIVVEMSPLMRAGVRM
jgi:hypothetical protein